VLTAHTQAHRRKLKLFEVRIASYLTQRAAGVLFAGLVLQLKHDMHGLGWEGHWKNKD
jgi:hypothetical protein